MKPYRDGCRIIYKLQNRPALQKSLWTLLGTIGTCDVGLDTANYDFKQFYR